MTIATVAGTTLEFDPDEVRRVACELDPEPIRIHFVVIDGRRYPPKQVLAAAAGLDRADFTTHQARSVLRRLGFGVHRQSDTTTSEAPSTDRPHGGREAAALASYTGRWVAQQGQRVVHDADSPQDVVSWLRRHGQTARVWQVPSRPAQTGSTQSVP